MAASPASGKNVIAAGATLNSHVPGYILKLEDKHVADIRKALLSNDIYVPCSHLLVSIIYSLSYRG